MEVKLLGNISKEYIDGQLNICAAAGKLSRMPGTVFDAMDAMNDPEKAVKFIKRVINMGHTSTIDHDYMVFALSEVTPLVEQTIIAERFSSFTIKSRREVNFANVGYYIPDFKDKDGNIVENNNELKEKYTKHMDYLFNSYQKFIDGGISKEDARFILPYSYHSEIIMGLDGTSLARMINLLTKTKYSKIIELKTLGEKLEELASTRAPYLKVLLDREEVKLNSDAKDILDDLGIKKEYKALPEPILVSATPNIDETLFVNAIARIYGKTIEEAKEIYINKIKGNENIERPLMKAIFNEVSHEDLRQINLRYQLNVPFAILTHYTRHRRPSLSIPDFSPLLDLKTYITPPSIKNSDLNEFFNKIFECNNKIAQEFKSYGIRDEDLAYFTLSGNSVNVIINFDGEAFRWICRLRECTKAQWRIRNDVTKMHKLIAKQAPYFSENLGPDCVTKHICGEGKESCGRINKILEKEYVTNT